MKKGIFITATGTDVGKTYISALILKHLLALGLNVGYYKPALSGAVRVGDKLVPGDCKFVLDFAGVSLGPQKCLSYMFEEPVSPHLASQLEGVPIELPKILSDFKDISSKYDYMIVEGAGGIVCPFNLGENKLMIADVIKALGLDIIVVASASLGTINSTVLTIDYARSQNINVRGVILNNYDEKDLMQRDNLLQIENLTGVKVIATVKNGQTDLSISPDIFKEI